MSTSTELIGLLREALDAIPVDPAKAAGMRAYMKSTLPCRGVAMPVLRKAVRPIIAAHPVERTEWEAAIRSLVDRPEYREDYYLVLELGLHRVYRAFQDPAALDLYRHVVVTTAWWDVVDATATDLIGPIVREYPAQKDLMRAWAVDDDLWLRRTAILCQLLWREATDLGLLAEVIDANLEGTRYGSVFWIRKAIGWALRHYARTDPDFVRAFVAARPDRLSGLSRREALKHL